MEGRPPGLLPRAAHLERRPSLELVLELVSWRRRVLLSFERPPAESPRWHPRRTLKTAFAWPNNGKITVEQPRSLRRLRGINDHRQDSKGTRWMPWH
jgi:hypothetical protein